MNYLDRKKQPWNYASDNMLIKVSGDLYTPKFLIIFCWTYLFLYFFSYFFQGKRAITAEFANL